jgi:hypothetical protein
MNRLLPSPGFHCTVALYFFQDDNLEEVTASQRSQEFEGWYAIHAVC